MSGACRGRAKGVRGLRLSSEVKLVSSGSKAGGMGYRGLRERYEGTCLSHSPGSGQKQWEPGIHEGKNKNLSGHLGHGTRGNPTLLPLSPPGWWDSGSFYA